MLSILNENETLLGFCVVTHKRGGSVKTGPTMFYDKYQKKGYGVFLRRALEDKLRDEGYRKIYCTSSANNRSVISYLLFTGYRVEVQLSKQYGIYDELVFGKFLQENPCEGIDFTPPLDKKFDSNEFKEHKGKASSKLASFIQKNFSLDVVNINLGIAKNFLRDAFRSKDLTYEDKPKKIIPIMYKGKVVMIALLLPKRGGSIKCVLLSETNNVRMIKCLVQLVEEYSKSEGRKRLYFTIPEYRSDIVKSLRDLRYLAEGLLHAPYKPGRNFVILAKKL